MLRRVQLASLHVWEPLSGFLAGMLVAKTLDRSLPKILIVRRLIMSYSAQAGNFHGNDHQTKIEVVITNRNLILHTVASQQ